MKSIRLVLVLTLFSARPSAGAPAPFPLKDPSAFQGIELRWTSDNLLGDVLEWLEPRLKKESGLAVAPPFTWATSQGYEVVLPQLVAPESRWDLLVTTPQYLGDFVETGGLEPLDARFAALGKKTSGAFWSDVVPAYRDFYTRWNGKTYAIPLDGDVLALHYRPSFFADEGLKKSFREKHGRELKVPETWEELRETAWFFTEALRARDVYGIQIAGTAPWVWAYWFTHAAAEGVSFFDDAMNPAINSPKAVSTLEAFVETMKWAPPGIENLGGDRLVKNWQAGRSVMALWYYDLTELGGQSVSFQDDVASAPVPGVREKDGGIRRAALMPYGRVAFIPRNIPEKRKRAAFYAAVRLASADVSRWLVADPRCGMDPFRLSHFEAPERYVSTGPFGATYAIFSKLAQAERHLDSGKRNLLHAYPQPTWPGASRYLYALGTHVHKAVLGQETAKQALDAAAAEWTRIRDQLGRKDQLAGYRQYQAKLRALRAATAAGARR